MTTQAETTEAFVLSQLPPPPARVLEVGCGDGRLALALADAGYRVTAIDPLAPAGPIFRRLTLEEFVGDERFAVAVAILSLHHIGALEAAVRKIARLLVPQGRLVVEEFAKERFLDRSTAEWYWRRRDDDGDDDFERWLHAWERDHADLHPFAAIRAHLDRRFVPRCFARVPYLHRYELDPGVEPVERALIARGEIQATGVRYAGELPMDFRLGPDLRV